MDITSSINFDSLYQETYSSPRHLRLFNCGRLHDGTEISFEALKGGDSDVLGKEKYTQRFEDVIRIWETCRHPNVVRLIGKTTIFGNLSAVYELHENIGAIEYLESHPKADRYQLVTQVWDGLAYLQANKIVHGNLTNDQILVSSDGTPRILISMETASTVINPPIEVEVVQGNWFASALGFNLQAPRSGKIGLKHTLASDVLVLGLTTLRIIGWDRTDSISDVYSSVRNRRSPRRTTNIVPENDAGNIVWSILCECWSGNPQHRPSAEHVRDVMNNLYQTPDGGMALRLTKLVVTDKTTAQDLVAYFEQRGLRNYTDSLPQHLTATATILGDTALATVYKATLPNQQLLAIKRVKHVNLYKRLKRAARELSCWSSYQHGNILPVYGFAIVQNDLAMVSPWMRNGYITDYVATNPSCNRLGLCTQLTKAIAHLHEQGVVHGDIKGPNVLVSDAGVVQVMDFGVSIMDHQEIEFTQTSDGGGTNRWLAPEILLGDLNSTKEADIYALAMTMIEIYTGRPPYGSTPWFQLHIPVVQHHLRPPRPTSLPADEIGNEVWLLMSSCWAPAPNERLTSSGAYERLQYLGSIRPRMNDICA
ncbi:hypothetical protein RSOLAG1IB_09841 [Rhizoctonia solani AG-1 IB]|uniref:Protein kinase domain-containing protein n=1 Tax=Thanatephorus cucumeris (strain AG1-IB / isolate 7/3/14) TaxID=1108050 RepID=A0A0B7FY92_THACB|nr:hypothetical protein RSOLAG1IB_09841 [Rhizoctonia solani AG-1 IB]